MKEIFVTQRIAHELWGKSENSGFINSDEYYKYILMPQIEICKLLEKESRIEELLDILSRLEKDNDKIINFKTSTVLRQQIGQRYHSLGDKFDNIEFVLKSRKWFLEVNRNGLSHKELNKFDYLLARSFFLPHIIKKRTDGIGRYTLEDVDVLLQAKNRYLKIWNNSLERKLNENILEKVITELSLVIAELNRWVEPFYFLDHPTDSKEIKKYIYYNKAIILEAYGTNSCSQEPYYPSYLKALIAYCDKVIEYSKEESDLYKSAFNLRSQNLEKLKVQNLSMEKLKGEHNEIEIEFNKHSKYRKFLLNNGLSLNEHSIYCKCSRCRTENLSLFNKHVDKFHQDGFSILKRIEPLLDVIKLHYSLACKNFYRAITKGQGRLLHKSEFEQKSNPDFRIDVEDQLLIDAFSQCFGILDKIAFGILSLFEIESAYSRKNVSFFNIFQTGLPLKEKISSLRENNYLIALYSIVCDLRGEYTALENYKDWRDSIEHGNGLFVLIDEEVSEREILKKYSYIKYAVSKDEFEKKTLLMLQLTRSAIFSFVFLTRRESKLRFRENYLYSDQVQK